MAHIVASFILSNQNNEFLTHIANIEDESERVNSNFENIVDQTPKQRMTALPGAEIFSSAGTVFL